MTPGNTLRDLDTEEAKDIQSSTEYRTVVGGILKKIGSRLFGEGNYAIELDWGSAYNDYPLRIVLARVEKAKFLFIPYTRKTDIVSVSPSWRDKWFRTLIIECKGVVNEEFAAAGLI